MKQYRVWAQIAGYKFRSELLDLTGAEHCAEMFRRRMADGASLVIVSAEEA